MNVFRFLNHKDCEQQYSMRFCSSISVGPRTSGGQSDGELVARLNAAVIRKGASGASVLCSRDSETLQPCTEATCAKLGPLVPLPQHSLRGQHTCSRPRGLGGGPECQRPLQPGLRTHAQASICSLSKQVLIQPVSGERHFRQSSEVLQSSRGAAKPPFSWAPDVTHGSLTSAAPASICCGVQSPHTLPSRGQAFPLQPLHPASRREPPTHSWLRAMPSFPGSPPPWKLLPQLHCISSSTALQRGDF